MYKYTLKTNQKANSKPMETQIVNQSESELSTNQKASCKPIKNGIVNQSKSELLTNQKDSKTNQKLKGTMKRKTRKAQKKENKRLYALQKAANNVLHEEIQKQKVESEEAMQRKKEELEIKAKELKDAIAESIKQKDEEIEELRVRLEKQTREQIGKQKQLIQGTESDQQLLVQIENICVF